MDTPSTPDNTAVPLDESPQGEERGLGRLRNQLESGKGINPPVDHEAIKENRNQPLANPRIQTPNIEDTKQTQ